MLADLRFSLRSLRRNPGFTALAVLTLALGIGATTAIYAVVDAVMLRPLPFPEADRLVQVWETTPEGDDFFEPPLLGAGALGSGAGVSADPSSKAGGVGAEVADGAGAEVAGAAAASGLAPGTAVVVTAGGADVSAAGGSAATATGTIAAAAVAATARIFGVRLAISRARSSLASACPSAFPSPAAARWSCRPAAARR